MKNEILIKQLKEFEMKSDLNCIELDCFKASEDAHKMKIKSYQEKLEQIDEQKESIINELKILKKVIALVFAF